MKTKEGKNSLVLIGKINEVSNFLRECQGEYIYVKDLINSLSTSNKTSYVN